MSEGRELTRSLGLVPAIAVNVGNMIGTGIFLKTRVMTCNVGASSTVLAVWVVGGLLVLAGAFAYSEVAAMMPEAGGEYVYLRRAYGRLVSFLCGWTFFTLARCGAQAALAVGFAIFMNVATGGALSRPLFEVPLPGHALHVTLLTVVAVGSIWTIAFLNCRPVARGGQTALGLTSIKVLFLLGLACAALLFGHGNFAHFGQSNVGGTCEGVADSARAGLAGLGAAMLGALWAYDGWEDLNLVGSEVENPQRNFPRALVGGVALVALIYLLFSAACLKVLPFDVVAASPHIASDVVQHVAGPIAGAWITVAMVISALGSMNSSVLSGARPTYAMARDGIFFKIADGVHPKYRTPARALIFQGVLTSLMALTGTFEELTNLFIFAGWIFYGLAVVALFRLRSKEPNMPRPYRCWGYPWVPGLFVAGALALTFNIWLDRPGRSSLGLLLMFAGLPFYRYWSKRASETNATPQK